MVEDKRQDIFGYNPTGKVTELQEVNTDAWPLISGSNQYTEKRQTASFERSGAAFQKKAPQQNGTRKPSAPKKAEDKKKTPYVSSSTGKAKKKKPEYNEGRISAPPFGKSVQRPASENKKRETVNNKKRPPERAPKGQRVENSQRPPQGRGTQGTPQKNQRKPEREALSKNQQKKIRQDNAYYERGTRQNKSKDDIRRERQQRQIKRRKRKTILAIFSFVFIVAFAFGIFIYNNVAIVNKINIEGNSTYSMKKIVKSCGVVEGDKLFSVREKRVRELLTKELPYIKDVEISYKLPDTLTITVTPTEDKLMLFEKNKYLRLDKDGKVVATSKTKMKDGLYKVEGISYKKHASGETYVPSEEDKSKYELARTIALEAEKAGLLSGFINVTETDKVTFTYDGRIRIYLGNASEIQAKMGFAAKTISVAAPDKQKGYIDMRFSERGYFSEGSMDNT